jgi:hypothetical protein
MNDPIVNLAVMFIASFCIVVCLCAVSTIWAAVSAAVVYLKTKNQEAAREEWDIWMQ